MNYDDIDYRVEFTTAHRLSQEDAQEMWRHFGTFNTISPGHYQVTGVHGGDFGYTPGFVKEVIEELMNRAGRPNVVTIKRVEEWQA